jgi:hypothetical protein
MTPNLSVCVCESKIVLKCHHQGKQGIQPSVSASIFTTFFHLIYSLDHCAKLAGFGWHSSSSSNRQLCTLLDFVVVVDPFSSLLPSLYSSTPSSFTSHRRLLVNIFLLPFLLLAPLID